jgi:hypothetical protein
MFPILETCCRSNETGAKRKVFTKHAGVLKRQFSLNFKDTDISEFEYVRNTSTDNSSRTKTCGKEQFTGILCDGSWKDRLDGCM